MILFRNSIIPFSLRGYTIFMLTNRPFYQGVGDFRKDRENFEGNKMKNENIMRIVRKTGWLVCVLLFVLC